MSVPYPCVSCKANVRDNQRGVYCDSCHNWIHLKCTNISILEYQRLAHSEESWVCYTCLGNVLQFQSLDTDEFASIILDMASSEAAGSNANRSSFSDFDVLKPVIDPDNLNNNEITCDYFNEFKFKASFNCNDYTNFYFLHMNIRSLSKHFDELHNYFQTLHSNFSVIGLSETWLKDSDMPFNIYSIPDYHLETNCRKDRVGAVLPCIFHLTSNIQFDLTCHIRPTHLNQSSLNHNNKNIIAGVVYKPPLASFNDFILTFQDLQHHISAENKSCLISGDFNINLLKMDNHGQTQEIMDFTHSFIPLSINPQELRPLQPPLSTTFFQTFFPFLILAF